MLVRLVPSSKDAQGKGDTPPHFFQTPSLQRPRLRDSPVSSQKLLCTYGLPPRLKKTSTQRE